MARVLVIDDEPGVVDLLGDLISDAGHTPLTAFNGADGLALAQAQPPDLIISDVIMPLMDGYALVEAVRSDPSLAHTMVLLMSANATPLDMYASEATAFTPKPLDLTLVEAFLGRLP